MVSKDQQETSDYDEPKVVWHSEWHTEEGSEAQALVMRSFQGYHARLSIATYNQEYDTPLGPAYPTKEEAIDAAENELTAWSNRINDVMSDHEDWLIAQYERRRALASASPAKIDRDDEVEPER